MRTINYTGIYSFHIDTNLTVPNIEETIVSKFDVMMILQMLIALDGIVANFTVVFAFLNHKQFRKKIPNMFIINQVSYYYLSRLIPKMCLHTRKLIIPIFKTKM